MKKRMTELETQIALQSENFNKISLNSNIKEEQLNNDITDYLNQINDLKNEMEILNNIITNLTEEKENNAIKITNLLHENEKLKQNIKNKNSSTTTSVSGGGLIKSTRGDEQNSDNVTNNNKKYEEIIMKLKKSMLNLKEEKKNLEEVILKKESEVNQLSSNVNEAENMLIKKDKELQESIEYSAKLTSSINFHKNEIIKIKQKQNQNDNNKNDKNSETILNLQKELQNMKKNLEAKESKLNVLLTNNKVLQDKLNKLTQVIKNELNGNNGNGNNSKYNNKNKNNIYSSYNNYYTNKITISKPQSQLKNKTTRAQGVINPISSNVLPKKNNMENYKDNHKNLQIEKSPIHNRQNLEDKKLYIISKHKIKSKTPGKLISSKHHLPETRQEGNLRQNIEIISRLNEKSDQNLDNLYPSIYNRQKKNINSKININEKYKQIESKYKNDKKEITKEDTLFNEEDINNLNIKKEIISPYIQVDEDIDSIPIFNSCTKNSQIDKTKKEGRNTAGPAFKKKNTKEHSSLVSQEKEFPIIESYCMMFDKENKSNYVTNNNNNNNNNTDNNNLTTFNGNESKIEAKQVQDLKERVNKILNEF